MSLSDPAKIEIAKNYFRLSDAGDPSAAGECCKAPQSAARIVKNG
jgi:hypothetical protein